MIGKMTNIPSTVDDPNYRYKMPRLELKIEGRGNGIKTNLLNLFDISKYLRVATDYPLKFIGYEMGTKTTFAQGKNDATTIIQGAFTEPELRKTLDKFIMKYICCSKCGYPEMTMSVKAEKVYGQCRSCGDKHLLDSTHKFAAYIIKKPPQDQSEFKKDEVAIKADNEAKKGAEKSEKTAKVDEGHKDEKKPAVQLDDLTLTSPVLAELTEKIRDIVATEFGSVESFEDNEEAFLRIYKEIKHFKIPAEKVDRIPYILFFAFFDCLKTIGDQKAIAKFTPLLQGLLKKFKFTSNLEHNILANLELFFLQKFKDQGYEKYIPTVLKHFYDNELMTEAFLISWSEGKATEALKAIFSYSPETDATFLTHSKPIIEWLKTAEAEGDEEEEEGEEPGKEKVEGEKKEVEAK